MNAVDRASIMWRKSSRSGSNAQCVEVGYVWRKSSRSGTNADCVEVGQQWRKSSHSGTNVNCVEVSHEPAVTAVRDSKNPDGPTLAFPVASFARALRTL
ncbi:hypothetical protein JOD54_002678 [Actinokineospora baliensis]|uniref:DUF397 domain-containing protein n=1 Tax=Actinokineospora baliensis TaxID=547056 RepID=UPI00195DA4C6|nr:DUF397 domain-containing protein [Actinokineospora baliensis]MBM7772474.1 hypothetical protein [Actinokineospora baliensis]